MYKKIIISILLLLPIACMARPVSYPGGYTIIQDNDYIANSVWAHYSLTAHDSFGARIDYLRENKSKIYTAQYTRLLKRLNFKNSQANLYIMGGLGSTSHKNADYFTSWAGLSSDWESRKWYIQYKNRFTDINGSNQLFHNRFRVGYAPYEANYYEIQPWVLLQVDKLDYTRVDTGEIISKQAERLVFTPTLRLFKGRYLAEFGVSSELTLAFNWIIRF